MQEGITASDVASANEFWDLCAVIELMEPQATADITEVSCYIRAILKLWQQVSLISKMFMSVCIRFVSQDVQNISIILVSYSTLTLL